MIDYKKTFDAVTLDSRYLANLDWGEARPGHPEGTVRAHLAEIEPNLEILRPKLTDQDYWKLKLLIHTHDSFKGESQPGVPITDPKSHASLARAFLALHCDDADLLAMVQLHDEPFALYRQFESKGKYNIDRFNVLQRRSMTGICFWRSTLSTAARLASLANHCIGCSVRLLARSNQSLRKLTSSGDIRWVVANRNNMYQSSHFSLV